MLKALEDRVILKVDDNKEEVSSSGFILQSTHEIKNIGTVVSVGPGRYLPSGIQLEQDVSVGDRVMFNSMATMSLEHEGKDYLSVFSRDILAIVNE